MKRWSSCKLLRAHATPDIGLKVVHEAEVVTLDIVFVHGFNGHRERTWTYKCHNTSFNSHESESANRPSLLEQAISYKRGQTERSPPKTEVFWPRDLLPSTVPNARVMVFGYDTKVHHIFERPRSDSTVYNHAHELLLALDVFRPMDVADPIIFIAHSLGGIVVKEALRQSKAMQKNRANGQLYRTFRSTIGVLFFGTPHAGADPRGWFGHVAEKAIRAVGFTANQQVLDTLLPGCDRLQELWDEFPMIVEEQNMCIVSFCETIGMNMFGGNKVVEKHSACLGLPDCEVVWDIDGDHKQICRFSSLEDPQYRKVATALSRIIDPTKEVAMSQKTRLRSQAALSRRGRSELKNFLYFKQMHARIMPRRMAQRYKCGWITESGPFRKWLETNHHNGILWIKEKPGARKSLGMRFLHSEAAKTIGTDILLAFFFNPRGNYLEKSASGLYRSLLFQLLDSELDLDLIIGSYGRVCFDHANTHDWQADMLEQILSLAFRRLNGYRVYCYIDALGECPENEVRDMISFFEEIGRSGRVWVCFSSRHYPEINAPGALQLILEGDQHDHRNEIKIYIDSYLNTPERRAAIEKQCQEATHMMFLLAWESFSTLLKTRNRGPLIGLLT